MSDFEDFEPFDSEDEPKKKRKHGQHYEWSDVWQMALTKPSLENYEDLLADPEVDQNRAFKWVFITGTIAIAASLLIQALLVQSEGFLFTLICGVLLGGAIVLIGFLIGNGITQGIAKLLGGEGTFGEFYYAAGMYTAPLLLINTVLSIITAIIPCLGLITFIVSIYQLVLTTIAVNAVNRFGWGKSIATVLIPVAILVGLAICLIAFLVISGPAIGNVFSNIVEELGTPQPR